MPTSVPEIILGVSRQLNDQDSSLGGTTFLRWPKVDLLSYLNDAIVQVANLCPHLVTAHNSFVSSVSGYRQTVPSPALDIIAVNFSLQLFFGFVYIPLLRVDSGFAKTYSRTTRAPSGIYYRPANWSYEPTEPNVFYVYPPVPDLRGEIFQVTYRGIPITLTSPDTGIVPFSGKYDQPIISWMQARAYEVDQESESSMKLAMMHRADFFKMMKAIIDTDQALHAGIYRAPGRRK